MEYRYFEVGRLFRLVNPKGKITSKQLLDGNDINYIAAKKTNNGVAKRCSQENIPDDQIMEGNCIVFIQQGDGSAGYTTYQPEDFYATSCVCCGYIDGILNEEVGLYLVSMLDMNRKYYSHSYGWNAERLTKTKISLPTLTNPDNTPVIDPEYKYHPEGYIPDWEYMQDYIKELEQYYIKELEQYLIVTGLNDYELTDENTGKYQMKEILENAREVKEFNVSNNNQTGLFYCFRGTRLTKQNRKPGNIPLLTAGNGIGEGVAEFINENKLMKKYKEDITIDMFGMAFYHDYEHYGDDNIHFLVNDDISSLSKLYITALIRKKLSGIHSYGYQFRMKNLDDLKLFLPIQLSNDNTPMIDPERKYHPEGYIPDWEYMEKYIKAIEKLVIKDVVKYKDELIEKMKGMVD